jgi:tetratricopeptide (TPR) repeat protein
MDLIATLLSHAEAGSGATVLVTGPGGIGKTSILRWLEESARSRNLWVRWGYCLPGIQDPFFAMEQVLRPVKGAARHDADSKSSPDMKELPLALKPRPVGSASSSGLPMAFIPFEKEPAGTHSSAKGAPANVLLDYLARIEREALVHPCVLLIDDFQWADPDSVEALRFLSRNIRRMPVLIVVALREDEVRSMPLHEVLRDLRRDGLAKDIPLAGLEEGEILNLLQNTIKAPLDDRRAAAAARFLRETTGGNPYFFLEVVRLWQEIGLIHIEGGVAVITIPRAGSSEKASLTVPDSVSNLLTRRLGFLNWEDTELLEGAAMLGQEFRVAPLEDLFQAHSETVRSSLEKLSGKRGLVAPKGAEGIRYAFTHTLLWETVRQSTPAEKSKLWAGKLAAWWAENLPADIDQIATLYELGGQDKMALECIDKAIDLSLQMHAHERVVRYFEKGLALMEREKTPVVNVAEWGLSVVDRLRGDGAFIRLVESLCRRLLQADPPKPLSWELQVRLANTTDVTGVREARQLLDKVYEETRQRPGLASRALQGRMAVTNSKILYEEGKKDASEIFAKESLDLLPEEERYFRGLVYYDLGWSYMDENNWGEAATNLEKGLEIARGGKIWGLVPPLLDLRGAIAITKGDLKAAEEYFNEAVATCRNLGQAPQLSAGLSNLSLTRGEMGNLDGAEEAAKEALQVADAFDLQFAQGIAAHVLGQVMVQRKALNDAMELFGKARMLYEKTGDTEMNLQLDLDTAEAMIVMGDAPGALAILTRLTNGDLMQDQVAQFHLLKARYAMATGAKEEARAEMERTLEESKQRGLRCWEGRAHLALSVWEKRYGSPEDATKALDEANRILKECGVVNVELFAP